jgi:hypothetical protein
MNHYPLGIRADEMTHLSLQIKCPCLLECEGDSPIVVCLVTEYHRSFDTIAIRTISHDKRGLLVVLRGPVIFKGGLSYPHSNGSLNAMSTSSKSRTY